MGNRIDHVLRFLRSLWIFMSSFWRHPDPDQWEREVRAREAEVLALMLELTRLKRAAQVEAARK